MPAIKKHEATLAHTEPFGHVGPFVYFIQAESGGPVKIGFTFDLPGRFTALQTSCPERLVVRQVVPGGRKEERVLHHLFAGCRTHGEWFEDASAVLAYAADANARMRQDEDAHRRRGDLWTEIQELYLSGMTMDRVAEAIGCSRSFVFTELAKMREARYHVPLRRVSKMPARSDQRHMIGSERVTPNFADDVIERLSA